MNEVFIFIFFFFVVSSLSSCPSSCMFSQSPRSSSTPCHSHLQPPNHSSCPLSVPLPLPLPLLFLSLLVSPILLFNLVPISSSTPRTPRSPHFPSSVVQLLPSLTRSCIDMRIFVVVIVVVRPGGRPSSFTRCWRIIFLYTIKIKTIKAFFCLLLPQNDCMIFIHKIQPFEST